MPETRVEDDLSPLRTANAAKPTPPILGGGAFTAHSHKHGHDPIDYVEALEDAERLLKYAAESGVAVDDATRDSVLAARATVSDKWDEKTVANLLAGLTKLAAELKPVTAESLRNFNAKPTVRKYWIVAIILAVFIIPYSVISFVASSISQTIGTEITAANELVLKLNSQLAAPTAQTPGKSAPALDSAVVSIPSLAPGVVSDVVVAELQTLAATIRTIYAQTKQLNWFIGDHVPDTVDTQHRSLELPVPLPQALLGTEIPNRIRIFQDVRFFGTTVVGNVAVVYGAVAACILPVLYALLGTCAFLLRTFSQQMSSRTFVPSRSDSPRFLIAAIGGAVVGFFGHLAFGQDTTISPFAIAFLVGYAVDIFFSFLDGLVQAFTKGKVPDASDAKGV
jgi:hypothetical protein